MRKYIYVKVEVERPNVWATDPSILEWIFDAVKERVPNCTILNEKCDVTGARRFIHLFMLPDQERDVTPWLMRLLCENGFEPFAVTGEIVHLRRMEE
jgi:hypothetical protein